MASTLQSAVYDDEDFVGALLEANGWAEGQQDGQGSPTQRLGIPLYDEPEADLLSQLPACLEFIAASLTAGRRILVHCAAGVSRSSSVCLMLLSNDWQMLWAILKSARAQLWANGQQWVVWQSNCVVHRLSLRM